MNLIKRSIIDHLLQHGVGKTNAVNRARLAAFVGCSDRILRDSISELRIGGYPIASNYDKLGGYYFPETRKGADETIDDLKHRARKMCLAAAGMTKGIKKLFPDEQQLNFTLE